MGNFHGHAIPGTLMLFLGLFYWLRCLKVSFLRGMRTKQFWLSFEPLGFVFYGAIGAIAEFTDALIPNQNFSESHLDHMHLTTTLCLMGLVELLHLYKVLDNPGWGFVMPCGFILLGKFFTAHPQGIDLQTFAHQLTAILLWTTGISRALEIGLGMYLNQGYLAKIQLKNATWKRKGGKQFSSNFYNMDIPRMLCCFCCSPRARDPKEEEEEIQLGMNPCYYNPAIYATPFPFLTAVSMLFNGVWWWEMAVNFFIAENMAKIPESQLTEPMATHYAYSHQVFPHLVWITFFLIAFTVLAKWIDRCYFLNNSLSDEEEFEYPMVRLDSQHSLNGAHEEEEYLTE